MIISQSEPAELTKYEIIGLLALTKHLTLNSKVKADLEFEGKAVENYINLANHLNWDNMIHVTYSLTTRILDNPVKDNIYAL